MTLNFNKTKHAQFAARSIPINVVPVSYHNNLISNDTNTKFLGMVLESSCIWKAHIFQLLPKLSKACYLMRVIKPIMSIKTLRIVYYLYFHSLTTYGLTFWGKSSYSLQIFRTQKRIIRIMCGLRPTDSRWNIFKVLRILPLQSQYIFSLLLFVIDHQDLYQTTSQVHGINTRCKLHFYYPQSSLTIHQNGPYYFGIRLFNHLPLYIRVSSR
jgi:hypothetical protein